MRYFPIFLDLRGKLCLVVGGGRVAERKVRSLLEAGAKVRVVSPALTKALLRFADSGKILHRRRPFQRRDLDGAHLAVAATDDRETNENVFSLCLKQRLWVNVVDDPAHSSFIVPSVMKRGDLAVAISTSGQSPALAKALRKKMEEEFGPEYSAWLKLLGALRKKVLALGLSPAGKKRVFGRLVREDLRLCIRRRDWKGLEARLKTILGRECRLSELGFRP